MDSIYELKQKMTLLERAHASAGMGHFVLDPKRKTIEFSSWVRENIGLTDMPIPLDRLGEIVFEDEREAVNARISEVLEQKQDFSFSANIITAKGKVRTQRISGIAAFENDQTREGLIGFFGILQEITQEERTKEELREARDAAQAELAARTNLLAIVSHEIRTPLGGILGIIDQLKRERSAEERDRALTLIEESCDVLLDTLDAILQQARIDQDVENQEMKRFRPLSVAQRVAELFRPLARRKGLQIEVDGPADAYARGDPARLQQIIANFVSNGVKFTQTGTVAIGVTAPMDNTNEWTFTVSDTGSGMDENRLAGIFDPFGASGSDTLGRSVGAGLGLSIIRDLIEVMGGRMQVESELGSGSTFAVSIPFGAVEDEIPSTALSKARGSASILVERATDRVQVEASVTSHGFEVVEHSENSHEQMETDGISILIADAGKLNAVSKEGISHYDMVIALVADGGTEFGLESLDALPVAIETVPNSQIARSLSEILVAINNDSA